MRSLACFLFVFVALARPAFCETFNECEVLVAPKIEKAELFSFPTSFYVLGKESKSVLLKYLAVTSNGMYAVRVLKNPLKDSALLELVRKLHENGVPTDVQGIINRADFLETYRQFPNRFVPYAQNETRIALVSLEAPALYWNVRTQNLPLTEILKMSGEQKNRILERIADINEILVRLGLRHSRPNVLISRTGEVFLSELEGFFEPDAPAADLTDVFDLVARRII